MSADLRQQLSANFRRLLNDAASHSSKIEPQSQAPDGGTDFGHWAHLDTRPITIENASRDKLRDIFQRFAIIPFPIQFGKLLDPAEVPVTEYTH